jgi:hypothetical protein
MNPHKYMFNQESTVALKGCLMLCGPLEHRLSCLPSELCTFALFPGVLSHSGLLLVLQFTESATCSCEKSRICSGLRLCSSRTGWRSATCRMKRCPLVGCVISSPLSVLFGQVEYSDREPLPKPEGDWEPQYTYWRTATFASL